MRLLILTPSIPFPLNEGGKISQFALIDNLRHSLELHLLIEERNNYDKENIQILKKKWENVHFHIFEYKIEEQKSIKVFCLKFLSSLFRIIRYQNTKKKQLNPNLKETEIPHLLNIYNLRSKDYIYILLNVLEMYQFDIVQIEFLEYADLALALPKFIHKIFVHHELRFARLVSGLQNGTEPITDYDKYVVSFIKQQEISLLKLYDSVFVFSEEDKNKLEKENDKLDILVAPFPVLTSAFKTEICQSAAHHQIDKLVFLGGESHAPNKDAIDWYAKEISTKIACETKLALHVIGKWNKETIKTYSDNTGIHFTGYIEDLQSYCENSIMLVPIRAGSGIRTKILYAMAYGVPVISTEIGCEGIGATDYKELLIANTPTEFFEKTSLLLKDSLLRTKISSCAADFVHKKYNSDVLTQLRLEHYNKCVR